MAENGNKNPVLKTIGVVATAITAICGVVIGVMNYMTEGKQDMVQESSFNILLSRVNSIEERMFELAMECGHKHKPGCMTDEECPDAHHCERGECVPVEAASMEKMIEDMSPAVGNGDHVEDLFGTEKLDKPEPAPPKTADRFDDFKQIQQYVIDKNAPWEAKK